MMYRRTRLLLLVALAQVLVIVISASTNTEDSVALKALKDLWKNVPDNWVGSDPCGSAWVGIKCSDSRVVSITLASINLIGQLSSDIEGLSELQTLDLSYNKEMTGPLPPTIGTLKKLSNLILIGCGFSGPIPDSIGSLSQLVYLSLNSNNFAGPIPSSLGNLSSLYWLDLADNRLSGTIPVSRGGAPGLDMLVNTKHFHFGKNQLSGEIPPQLFSSSLNLIHLLLDNNEFTGNIPSTLGLVRTLEVVRLDRNALSGPVPRNLNNLSSVQELFLSHNKLSGSMPDLTGLELLNYVDLSNNSFDQTDVPAWFSSLGSLTSLIMDNSNIQGQLPVSLFSLPQLQTARLKNNRINGTLNLGPSFSSQLQLIDLENNFIDSVTHRPGREVHTILVGNPICDEGVLEDYCKSAQLPNATYSTPPENCTPLPCSNDQVSSPKCRCAYPYTGDLVFRAPSFSNYGNATLYSALQTKLMETFGYLGQPVDSVSLSNPTKDGFDYLVMKLRVFPSGLSYFNKSGLSSVGFVLSNQTFKPPRGFGPFFFRADSYPYNAGFSAGSKKSLSTKIIIGGSIGLFFVIVLLALGFYAFRQKKRAETAVKKSDPFASWDANSNSGGVPQLKGARSFTFEEVKRFTNNFSEANDIGAGGYGKVYKGTLPDGRLVAIKRAQKGSSQGSLEFKTEIELLSRVHHRNLVALVGFCFDHDEQMLVYEYITNGTLKEALTGKSGIRLDWMRRLRIALGAAKGLQYLHDLANPRIIHRDVKSSNILLDERLNAKVADFGLCKLLTETEAGHVTTQVKGTMGYLDPEYYMTQQLTEKSDVYSYGVVLLEILTAKSPIERGKYIVREVKAAMDQTKEMYGLQAMLDPIVVASTMPPKAAERLVDLSLRCVEDSGVDRPTMSDAVKELESIMQSAGLNPNAESASASESSVRKGSEHPYTNENLVHYSGFYNSPSDNHADQPKAAA